MTARSAAEALWSRMNIAFRDIDFGRVEAQNETVENPDLLLGGYLDTAGVVQRILNASSFLVLGTKGSGKSALAEHLRLESQRRHDLFTSVVYLRDFPYSALSKMSGSGELGTNAPAAWAWLLLLVVLESLSQDQAIMHAASAETTEAIGRLRGHGLLPVLDIRDILAKSTNLKLKLDHIFEVKASPSPDSSSFRLLHVVENLKRTIKSMKGTNRHLVVIDGLDDVLTTKDIEFTQVAALVLEASRLNADLRQAGVPAKIVILCRTEFYDRLPGPNTNKPRQDNAIRLDWYHNVRKPEESDLLKLANLRAGLAGPGVSDILATFFPARMSARHANIARFLLDHTRHTPRDFLALLRAIQHYDTGGRLSTETVWNGCRLYSVEYFYEEIKNELDGYVDRGVAESALRAIGALGKQVFTFDELLRRPSVSSPLRTDDLIAACEALFDCSGLGTVQRYADGNMRTTFTYRNRHSQFDPDQELIVHRGMCKALNIPFDVKH